MSDISIMAISQHELIRRLSLWEDKANPTAPMSAAQKDLLSELTVRASQRPILSDFPRDDTTEGSSRAEPGGGGINGGNIVFSQSSDDFNQYPLPDGKRFETVQQFLSWFAHLEDSHALEEEQEIRSYLDYLHSGGQHCNAVLTEVTRCLDFLRQLQSQYIQVSTKTNALHEECEHLLAEQTHLVDVAEGITNELSYFDDYNDIRNKLSRCNVSVTNGSFLSMLSRLDDCIHHLTSNPQYKESAVYLTRFRQCLSEALGLIRTYVSGILMSATHPGQARKDVNAVDENSFAILYGKFRAKASKVKTLTDQLELRLDRGTEYEQVLSDIHQMYFTQRELLLTPSIITALNDLMSTHAHDHCALIRSGCSFMVHVCEDEHQLFYNFFSKHTDELDHFLERLCGHLYDTFRPLVIHLQHLETLAALCSVLGIEMVEERVSQKRFQHSAGRRRGLLGVCTPGGVSSMYSPATELATFAVTCRQLLQDVQERLVYRTSIYIRTDILNYSPADGDLAYPEKLEMMESIAESIMSAQCNETLKPMTHSTVAGWPDSGGGGGVDQQQTLMDRSMTDESAVVRSPTYNEEDVSRFTELPLTPAGRDGGVEGAVTGSAPDFYGMWYPTVRRTLVTLSKLHRCIDTATFQGLSQEALQACVESLKIAEAAITKKKSCVDGHLFVIKHLLILREQIAPFQADFSIRETHLDFSSIKGAAYSLIQKKKSNVFSLSSNNSLLQFIMEGTPQVTELFVDSKRDVDLQLKSSCERFIRHITDLFTSPMDHFLHRAGIVLDMKKNDGSLKVTLCCQPFATPEKVHDIAMETYRNIKVRLPDLLRSMSLYLANRDAEAILFRPIKVNVQQKFQVLSHLLEECYTEEDRMIVGCPSQEQMNLLLVPRAIS